MKTFRDLIKNIICTTKDNIDDLYCDNCKKETLHEVQEDGHERDSSGNKYKCLECGHIKYGWE